MLYLKYSDENNMLYIGKDDNDDIILTEMEKSRPLNKSGEIFRGLDRKDKSELENPLIDVNGELYDYLYDVVMVDNKDEFVEQVAKDKLNVIKKYIFKGEDKIYEYFKDMIKLFKSKKPEIDSVDKEKLSIVEDYLDKELKKMEIYQDKDLCVVVSEGPLYYPISMKSFALDEEIRITVLKKSELTIVELANNFSKPIIAVFGNNEFIRKHASSIADKLVK